MKDKREERFFELVRQYLNEAYSDAEAVKEDDRYAFQLASKAIEYATKQLEKEQRLAEVLELPKIKTLT